MLLAFCFSVFWFLSYIHCCLWSGYDTASVWRRTPDPPKSEFLRLAPHPSRRHDGLAANAIVTITKHMRAPQPVLLDVLHMELRLIEGFLLAMSSHATTPKAREAWSKHFREAGFTFDLVPTGDNRWRPPSRPLRTYIAILAKVNFDTLGTLLRAKRRANEHYLHHVTKNRVAKLLVHTHDLIRNNDASADAELVSEAAAVCLR